MRSRRASRRLPWPSLALVAFAAIVAAPASADEVDAAARVLHPVFHGYGPGVEPLRGVFLKDYVATEW